MTAGVIYKFKYRAVNLYGVSDWSEELDAGVSSLPAKPNQVRKIEAETSETHITVEWDTSADTELPVIGYSLKINDGVGGDVFTDVFASGKIFPNVKKYVIGDLVTGLTYGFTIEALNFNGASEASDPAFFIICTKPKELAAATMPAVTSTTLTLAWLAPNITGGCPILSYSIYQQDLVDPSTYTEVDPLLVNNLIALRSHTLTYDSAETGTEFTYYISASNVLGAVESPTFSFTLAAVPDMPTDIPTLNLQFTSSTAIHVDYAALS